LYFGKSRRFSDFVEIRETRSGCNVMPLQPLLNNELREFDA